MKLLALSMIAIWLAAITGWVMNIVSLVQAEAINGLELVRLVGIFVLPLGAVLGYI